MTPKKAIEILKLQITGVFLDCKTDTEDAIQLGIEALQEKLEREKGGN